MNLTRQVDGWEYADAYVSSLPEPFREHAVAQALARTPLNEFEYGQWSYCRRWLEVGHENVRHGNYAAECHAIGTNGPNNPKPRAPH